eukprot:SAG11_NODE_33097_length_279_cov_0.577778_1_plen_51_part_01
MELLATYQHSLAPCCVQNKLLLAVAAPMLMYQSNSILEIFLNALALDCALI